jgi:superfamily I DNA and/or RNA helicase
MTCLGEIDFVYTPVINFAMQQNHVPVVKKLSAKNITENDLENVIITIQSDPEFAVTFEHSIDFIRKDEIFELTSIALQVSPKYLAELTERISGNITLSITANNQNIFKEIYPIDLLAYDQWNGVAILPELISTFVTPNHPQLPKVIKRASEILRSWTGSPSFDEYQSRNPDRVKKQMAAIYEAISEMKIVYCSVPASFEERGQRVRMCDTIFSTQMGNCLDLSLLFAGCLEAVGIHPLVIVIKGHAFAGGWLIDESFADAVNDDPSLITKRTAEGINEIALVEATCMNAGNDVSFDSASASADFKMVNEEDFLLFVDVKRSRFSGIRPLPLRLKNEDGWQIIEEKFDTRNNDLPDEITAGVKLVNVEKIDVTKQTLWERKLLDLTLRNSLLNLRVTKNTIQFIGLNLIKLEDSLAQGDELQILSRPTDWDNPLRNVGVYQSINQSDPVLDLIKHEFTQKRLRAYLSEAELLSSIVSLYRSSRLSLEENGANTLYIALGLLKWYETKLSERPRYAPLLLVPVEIIKKSAQKGFVIRTREEETMMNITLLEMLRQDFSINIGGLENLPKDDSGVDVKTVFNIVRQAIMTQKGWDVEEQCFLSTFSFSKFILWNDIHNNAADLLKNKVVRSLVSGKLEWQPANNNSFNDLDKDIHPANLSLPISSDASQLEAIITSANNESFVLHGPPGTGKSQTITNIIANALYQGKKVLFVSAKKAALDVVNNRLHSIGISPFCLELHSNKSKKSAVLDQLRKTIEAIKNIPPYNYNSEAERLYHLRTELNEYVTTLHHKQSFGFSLFELFDKYSELKPGTAKVFFSSTDIHDLSLEKLVIWNDIVEEMKAIGNICTDIPNHPLKEIKIVQYTQQIKGDARQYLVEYANQLSEYQIICTKVTSALKMDVDIKTKQQADVLKNIISLLLSLPDIPSQLFGMEHAEQNLSQIIGVAEHGNKRDEIRNSLLQQFNNAILSTDAEKLLTDWNIAQQKWFLPKLLKQNSIAKSLRNLSQTGRIEKTQVSLLLEKIIAYKGEQDVIDKATGLPQTLQFLWKNAECNWNELITICYAITSINREASKLNDPVAAAKWRSKLSDYFSEGSKAYLASQKDILEKYNQLITQLYARESKLKELLQIDFVKLENIETSWIESSAQYAQKWVGSIERLKDWTSWNQVRTKAIKEGLPPIVTAYENGDVHPADIITEYKRGLYKNCADFIIDNNPNLASFNGKLFDEKIRKFKAISRLFEKLTKEELYARLAANIPDFTKEAAQSSELGMLQRTIKNNGRGISIRKLFDSIPNLLPKLAPCMLMSPISVAQYFDTTNEKFDLLVFDEASQLPTCEAVGAIARAGNVIVVGDPKQMPPTSFFASNNVDEDNMDKEDLESILDDCLALSIPSQHLLWHYRSKHESLIAFSNAKYYDNKLLTFPSTDDIISKVTYIKVEGYYDKGKTRQNSFEAKAIVEEVVRRLSDPELTKRSIGIVTFSVVQQFLIEDLLNEVFKSRPDLERLATETEEPLFIKNLENVQGDERDVILFSVGYGPDKEGKVSLNFGPINREGGWRRLNVAVTRARYEMKVFATLKADQIDLARTASEGVAGLRAFLAFAEKGKTALPNRSRFNSSSSSAFSNMLATKIQQHGYHIHTDIGSSTYKIDIGVINPVNSMEYLLGILCDGDSYFKANTTRDREITQPDVLESLGWNIYKVWSADWWENPDKTITRIIEAIKEAESGESKKELPPVVVESAAIHKEFEIPLQSAAVPIQPITKTGNKYEVCKLEITLCNSSEEFLYPSNRMKITDQIKKVLEVEAPVSKNLLCKRILSAWGISRNGARLNNYFESLFSGMDIHKISYDSNIFFWKQEQDPTEFTVYRSAENDHDKRSPDDIPPMEIANAVKQVLKEQISLSKNDLIRETAKLFMFSKVGTNVETAMKQGIKVALENGDAKENNGRIGIG